LVLTCSLNSTSAYYKASKNTKNTKTVQIYRNKTLNRKRTNTILQKKKQYKRSTGAKPLYPEKNR
jgi:serine/threonine-protein kinase RIO1